MSVTLYEPSLEAPAAGSLNETTVDSRIFGDTITSIPQTASFSRLFRRPNWLSPEIWAFVVGGIDFCLVPAAAVPAFTIYSGIMDQTVAEPGRHVLSSLFAATVFVGLLERVGGYQLRQLPRLYWQLRHVLMTWGLTVAVLLVVAFFSKTSDIYSRGWMLSWFITVPVLLLIGRGILHGLLATGVRGGGSLARNVVIVGAGDEAERLIAKLQAAEDKTISIYGVFDDRKSRVPSAVCGLALRGTTDDLIEFARLTPVDEIVIALPLEAECRIRFLCDKMKAVAVDVCLSLEPLSETFRVRRVGYAADVPVLHIVNRPLKNWSGFVKILEDKVLGLFLLIMVSPLMVLIAILIKLDSRGPIFFMQKRFGFNNEVIRVFKFRTMGADRSDPSGAERTIRDDPRVTRLGRLLRRLSFDELPQLINVVRGEMSLVGPRPHAIAMKTGDRLYCDAVEQYIHRHRVRPGLTGWAQVNGLRGEVDTLQKAHARVAHDLYYIEHWSPSLDLKILLKTVGLLISRDNAY
jgi:Undecaprenyl-phosphate glucose phosphotransferase